MEKSMIEEGIAKRNIYANQLLEHWTQNDIGNKVLSDLSSTNSNRAKNAVISLQMQENYMKSKWKKLNEALISAGFETTPETVLEIALLGAANSFRGDIFTEYSLRSVDDAIYFLDMTYEQTLRGATAGEKLYENINKFYAGTAHSQNLGTGSGSVATFTGTLASTPVVPFTVRIMSGGAYIGVDDGQGNIVGGQLSAGTIDYSTGAISITFTANVANGLVVACEFSFDSEIASNYNKFGTVGITARKERFKAHPMPLGYEFSDMSAITLETTGLGDISAMIKKTVSNEHARARDYRAIGFGRQLALSNGLETFDADFAGAGEVSDKLHSQKVLSFIDDIGGNIYDDLHRGSVNVMVAGSKALTYLKKHDLWKTDTDGVQWGVYRAGFLDGRPVFTSPAHEDVLNKDEVLLTFKNPDDTADLSVVFGVLTEISAELRYPEMYTKGNLAIVEDQMVVQPKFLRLMKIDNI